MMLASLPRSLRNKYLIFLLAVGCSLIIASGQEPVPTIRILPEDVVQGSIERFPFSFGTNKFMVRWTYTEAGANKMLAFWRAQAGQQVITQVGSFEMRARIYEGRSPGWTEEGWLKWRTDKFFGVTEEDASKIVAGLKGK